MKTLRIVCYLFIFSMIACSQKNDSFENAQIPEGAKKVLFLHHSTGNVIFYANRPADEQKGIPQWVKNYNQQNASKPIAITELAFPQNDPYGWKNYPYDYYNIWVKNGALEYYQGEPTLKKISPLYDLIVFKHCYPVSALIESAGADINSEEKTVENYKLQYNALKIELKKYPNTKFLVWTGAALVKGDTNEKSALRAQTFFNWVKSEWDEANDNIYLFDFWDLETEGGLYLLDKYAKSTTDSHPNTNLAEKAYPLFAQRIVDVLYENGLKTNLKGEQLP